MIVGLRSRWLHENESRFLQGFPVQYCVDTARADRSYLNLATLLYLLHGEATFVMSVTNSRKSPPKHSH